MKLGTDQLRPWLCLAIMAILTTAACTNSPSDSETLTTTTTTETPTTKTTATTTPPTTPTTNTAASAAELNNIWQEFITIAAARSNPERLTQLADPETAAAADRKFFDPRNVLTYYTQTIITNDTATIEDCALFDKPLSTFAYIPMTGQAQLTNGQWQLTALEVNSSHKCIPGDLATEVLTAYESYWDARVTFRNPPDPDHPLINQHMAGDAKERMVEILEYQVEFGDEWRGRPTTHPEFVNFIPGQIIIEDCQLVEPGTGIYDIETGERTNNYPKVEPGQTDSLRIRLDLIDNRWKVVDASADRNNDCEFAPTDAGIPIVGTYQQQ